jgi:hypothetical protein
VPNGPDEYGWNAAPKRARRSSQRTPNRTCTHGHTVGEGSRKFFVSQARSRIYAAQHLLPNRACSLRCPLSCCHRRQRSRRRQELNQFLPPTDFPQFCLLGHPSFRRSNTSRIAAATVSGGISLFRSSLINARSVSLKLLASGVSGVLEVPEVRGVLEVFRGVFVAFVCQFSFDITRNNTDQLPYDSSSTQRPQQQHR